jgi:hypothetical protein
LKEAYIACNNEVQAKLINESLISKNNVLNCGQHPIQESQKKTVYHNIKNDDDEDFKEEDIEDEDDDVEFDDDDDEFENCNHFYK